MPHIPVLLKEVVEWLNPQPGQSFIDATVSAGGHASAILEKTGPTGKLLGIEWDPEIFKELKSREGMTVVNDSYVNIKKIAEEQGFNEVNGILFDLGISSWHVDQSGRGFSFQKEELLDMRFNPQSGMSALEVVNTWTEEDLTKIIKEYGEEGYADRIARAIIEARGEGIIKNSSQLAEIIGKVVPRRGKINPATKTFQALRIVVNGELENVATGIKEAIKILKNNGRLAVISFQGLEDKIVKSIFREAQKEGSIEILTKKVVRPSWDEIQQNPRSRSAKMRVILKIS
ncbi:MAG: 16S rRNA (cytosine(1402)-N(4))-methyltransferase RsmH [bacterium]|nr:16S rRNA (cytosine(1402)-N(4))-methyltransferase RsmH [bacterium]